jgi:hypothetical protein
LSEEPTAKPDSPPPPLRWRVILARVSQVLGLLSCFAGLMGSLVFLACQVSESSRVFVKALAEWGSLFYHFILILWAFALFSGVLAVLLGVLSSAMLWRRNRSTPAFRLTKAGFALGCIGVVFTLLSAQILPVVTHREASMRSICQNNLKQIGVCLRMYAEANQGTLPDKLSALYPDYASGPEVFVCPASGNKLGDPMHIDDWTDYTYFPGLRMTQPIANSRARACYHYEQDAELPGWNELYLDGHVEYRVDWDSPRAKQQKEY